MEFYGHFPLGTVGLGSPLVRSYFEKPETLQSFFEENPNQIDWEKRMQIKRQHFGAERRKILVNALKNQYGALADKATMKQILALEEETTFTVTTGHQLSFGTGPLFFFYKLASVVRLAQDLNEQFPNHHVVPVYWMNSEDHDLQEIRPLWLKGKRFELPHEDKGQATGLYGTSELKEIWEKMKSITAVFPALEKGICDMQTAYHDSNNLAEAIRRLVSLWTKGSGLLVLDQQDEGLKRVFAPIMEQDLLEEHSSKLVEKTTHALISLGYKGQVVPREINFFFHSPSGRKRIVRQNETFNVLETDLSFSEQTCLQFLREKPASFSPNVVTRPLYQESVLPNLAYFGGPSEVHYWLQYKAMFDFYRIPFPAVLLRDSFLVLPVRQIRQLESQGIALEEWFVSPEEIPKRLIAQWEVSQEEDLGLALQKEVAYLKERLAERHEPVDDGIARAAQAAWVKFQKRLEVLEKKRFAALKKKHAHRLDWLQKLNQTVYPNGVFQERHEHILSLGADPHFTFQQLISLAQPLKPGLKVLLE